MKDKETRTYTVPLRRGFQRAPKWRQSKKAVDVLKKFTIRHAKVERVNIGKWANEFIWEKGGHHPPAKIIVTITKEKDKANVELATLPAKVKRLEEKVKAKETAKKKREAAKKAKEETKKKKEEHKKKKEEEKKKLEASKKKAKMTKKQEMSMHK